MSQKKRKTHRGGDPPASHAGNPERAFTELLAGQSQLETEFTVASTNHHRAVLLWKVSHTGIKAQITIVPQGLGQSQELKNVTRWSESQGVEVGSDPCREMRH